MYRLLIPHIKPSVREIMIKSHWAPGLTRYRPIGPTGDFNSHSTEWGYRVSDKAGEQLSQWANDNSFHILYDQKQSGSHHSGAGINDGQTMDNSWTTHG